MPTSADAGHGSCFAVLTRLLDACRVPDPAAKGAALIGEFGSLSAVLAASPTARTRVLADEPDVGACLDAVREAMLHALKGEVVGRSIFSTSEALISYLRLSLADAAEEELRVLFLNARNELLRDEQTFAGTATAVVIRPRPIIKRALELGATALILVHNHPSGDPTPSEDDVRATAALVAAATPMEIVVHDHIIVGGQTWTSLKTSGLMRSAGRG